MKVKPSTVIFLLVAAVLTIAIWKTKHEADLAAEMSAQHALFKEISDQLEVWPAGQAYPTSLSQLRLTFPDGGDASLLKKFDYNSTGTSCSLRTSFESRELVRSFP